MTIEDEINALIDKRVNPRLENIPTTTQLSSVLAAISLESRKYTDEAIKAALASTQPPPVTQPPVVQPPPVPPTNPPVTPANPSGVAPPAKADFQGWKIVEVLDFNTPYGVGSFGPDISRAPAEFNGFLRPYSDGWKDTAGSNNGQPSRYSPSTVLSVSGGCLVKNLYNNGQGARSAAVQVGGDQLGGRYSIRARMRHTRGSVGWKSAWLLWPARDSDWPKFGEIDYPEGDIAPNSRVGGYLHVQDGGAGGQGQMGFQAPTGILLQDWHTYDTEWLPPRRLSPTHPGFVRHYVDGQMIFSCTDASKVPAGPMHWVIQTESVIDGPYSSQGSTALVEIDWLGIWKSMV